jgi:hypothetical protein
LASTSCLTCPTAAQDAHSASRGDGNGGCVCTNPFVWTVSGSSGSCTGCNSADNVVLLANGSCFTCGTAATNTTAKIVSSLNNSCTCTSTGLVWNSKGYC